MLYSSSSPLWPLLNVEEAKEILAGLALAEADVHVNASFTIFYSTHSLKLVNAALETARHKSVFWVTSVNAVPSKEDVYSIMGSTIFPSIANWAGNYAIFSILEKDLYLIAMVLTSTDVQPIDFLVEKMDLAGYDLPSYTKLAVKWRGRNSSVMIGTPETYSNFASRNYAHVQVSAANFEQLIDTVVS